MPVTCGDFDSYLPLEQQSIDTGRIMSVVINLYCAFKDLFDSIQIVKNLLKNAGYENEAQILIRPCFVH